MDNLKIKFFQKFWYINNRIVTIKHKDCLNCLNQERTSNESFYRIEPVYVYSINQIWNGTTTFDVCLVDFSKVSDKEKKENNWKMRFSVNLNEIDNFEKDKYGFYIGNVFTTKEKAKKMFNLKYSKNKQKIYKKLNKIYEKGCK